MKVTLRLVLLYITMLGAASVYAASEAPDTKPLPIRTPQPEYPADLRAQNVEGTVVLAVSIDEKGEVTTCEVTKSTDKRFEAAAVEAVRKWKFNPATKNKTPVSCKVTAAPLLGGILISGSAGRGTNRGF
jgi:protein TonB